MSETVNSEMNDGNNTTQVQSDPNETSSSDQKTATTRNEKRIESANVSARAPVKKKRHQKRDPKTIERANLLNIYKLVIKELIDSSLSEGRMLDDDHLPLQQFFVVLEHILRHGLKPKKGILRDKKEFWEVLESVEKFVPEAGEITTSVREMPHIKTPLGKARAWLRLAAMQKKLSDYFRVLVDKKDDALVDHYEPGAMMVEDEGMVVAGLLVGLNVIDCNMCIKGEDLDQPMGVIDFSLYLKETRSPDTPVEDGSVETHSKMATILDQKNYLEELNRHLNATVTNLQQRLEKEQATTTLMKEDLAIAKNSILDLQATNEQLASGQVTELTDARKQLEAAKQDIAVERETYQTSRAGLDNMYTELKHNLQEETNNRLEVEKELQLQISMKQEMEIALQLIEKDIHEKQDTMIQLRKQLEDVKTINLDLYNKLQACEQSLKHKAEVVNKLEEKTNQLVTTLKDLEKRLKNAESDKRAAEETARKLGQALAEKDNQRSALETDLRVEHEWRLTLQKTLDEEKASSSQLQSELQRVKDIEKEYRTLKKSHQSLAAQCEEQEKTLAELGSHLSESKLKVEDMKEATQLNKEATWQSDKEVNNCKACNKEFSIARRKHHCRHCGDIFCNECSDNKMPLPSSAKPVRVCDTCHTGLLQRYSSAS